MEFFKDGADLITAAFKWLSAIVVVTYCLVHAIRGTGFRRLYIAWEQYDPIYNHPLDTEAYTTTRIGEWECIGFVFHSYDATDQDQFIQRLRGLFHRNFADTPTDATASRIRSNDLQHIYPVFRYRDKKIRFDVGHASLTRIDFVQAKRESQNCTNDALNRIARALEKKKGTMKLTRSGKAGAAAS